MDLIHILMFLILHGGSLEIGVAPHYAPHLMNRVAAHRHRAPASCMVSRPHNEIGEWVWVYGKATGNIRRCLVMDVSAPKDAPRHIRQGRVVELSFEVTLDLCGSTKTRAADCPVWVWKDP